MAVARTIPSLANPDLLTFTIKIDGEPVSREHHVMSISVHKEINKVPYAKLKIADGIPSQETFPVSNAAFYIPGKAIEISLGYHSRESLVFKGIITTHSNRITTSSSELNIECKDASVKMTIGRNSKHYNDVTDSDVAEELVAKYPDLSADIASTNIQHKNLLQFD